MKVHIDPETLVELNIQQKEWFRILQQKTSLGGGVLKSYSMAGASYSEKGNLFLVAISID